MSREPRILWADDEIDLLKPHLLFLTNKGYELVTANNGRDALDMAFAEPFDLIILDENMPGLTGLETLSELKQRLPQTPVIMITKSEEENIMDQAVGSKIADYLIKPVSQSDSDSDKKAPAFGVVGAGKGHARLSRGVWRTWLAD